MLDRHGKEREESERAYKEETEERNRVHHDYYIFKDSTECIVYVCFPQKQNP